MSGAMLVRIHTTSRRVAAVLALLATFGAGVLTAPATRAASEANGVLFGQTTSRSTTTTRTNTAVTRTQAPVRRTRSTPAFTTPHIASTVPQGTPATGGGAAGKLGLGATPTKTTGSTPPSTSTTASTSVTATTTATATTPAGATITPAGTATGPQTATTPAGAGILPGRTATLRATKRESTSLSPVAIVAAALAVLLILLCLVWGFTRWYAYEPHWTLTLRHSLGEAGLRLSSNWRELTDWTRLGR